MARLVLRGVCRAAVLLPAIFCLRLAPALAGEPIAPGLHDLVVLDPGAHERGLPAVEIDELEGGMKIDIPPTVHVHRYFYSGDKIYQGPIINGGPTVVVANHPKTGQRMYIDVQLPAGAPRIAYNKHRITYVYTDQRVEVKFQHFPLDPSKAVVKYHHGKGWRRHVHDSRKHIKEHVKDGLANSQMVHSIKEVTTDGGKLLTGVRASLGELSTTSTDALKTLANMVPGVTYLKSLADQKPDRDYASKIRGAALTKEANEPVFLPTNR